MERQLAFARPGRRHPIRAAVHNYRVLERRRRDDADAKLFLLSFAAFFVCFTTFIM